MKRILFVLDNYYPHIGGAETLFQNLAETLAQESYTVTVVTPRSFPDYKPVEVHKGVQIYRTWVPAILQRYFFTVLAIPKVMSLARQHDIIHTTTYNAAFSAWIAAKLTGRKSLITIHEVWRHNWFRFGENRLLSAVLYMLEQLVLALKFDLHICVSNSTEKAYLAVYPTRPTTCIYPGVNYTEIEVARQRDQHQLAIIRQQLGYKPNDFLVLGFGRTGLSKGFEYLVRAIPGIHERIPNSHFMFIWPTAPNFVTLREQLESEIAQLPPTIPVVVHKKKPRQELLSIIQAANCVVIPSLSEGFGYAVVESCCLCDKVVASDTTSIPEVVGGNYVLAEPGNPTSIADAVTKAYKGEYKITERPITFTVQRMVEAYKKVYKSL